jgi:hypothetical protein
MKRRRKILMAAAGLALVGVAAGEYAAWRRAERRAQEAAAARQELELRVGEMLATHAQVQADLQGEQERSRQLSETLSATRGQLEKMTASLAEERQGVRTLQARLGAMQQQMDQLQGELALTFQERQQEAGARGAGPVQLERIVVSNEALPGLRGRVVSVHRDWDFVVISLGWDAVKIGDTLSIFREERLLAKARVERVQEDVCAATVLPGWDMGTISVNDEAQVL